MYIHIYIYIYIYRERERERDAAGLRTPRELPGHAADPRAEKILTFCILRIVSPRIFESKFRNHCAKKLVDALRKPTSLM